MNNPRVCEIHETYCPDGNCPWCEPLDPPVAAVEDGQQPPPCALDHSTEPPKATAVATGWDCGVNGHLFTHPVNKCTVCGDSLPFRVGGANYKQWKGWFR